MKYFIYLNNDEPVEFDDIDVASEYYASLYMKANKLKLTDNTGKIICKKN